jgi:peptide/nickel transport system substrate-binding protein
VLRPGRRLLAVATAVALVVAGCGPSHHRSASPQTSFTEPTSVAVPGPTTSPPGEVSFAVGSPAPDNWNVLAAGGAGSTLDQVAAQLWPSAFVVGPNYLPVLNAALLTSATVTSESPQIVVYRINPSASWSDGVAITGQDFLYNWLAQAGRRSRTDINGRPFTPASTAGYSQVSSVDVAPRSPDVVTVRFTTPYPDWRSLFSYLIPAHVAERIGFDDGFRDPVADLVSAGPYVVQSYTEGRQLRLVRNPSFSGPPGSALALDFYFLPYPPQMVNALSAGQVSCADVPATPASLSPLMRDKSLSVRVTGGSTYLDLDFREGTGVLASATRRQEVVDVVDRQAITTAVVGTVLPGATPVANRFFIPGQTGYVADGPATGPIHPGPSAFHGLRLRLITGSDPYSAAAALLIGSELKAAGVGVTVEAVASVPAALAGTDWDLAIEARSLTPYPGSATHTYLAGSPSDVDGADSPVLDALVARADAASGPARLAVIDEIDRLAWRDAVDLPLFTVPIAVACQSSVLNVAPNPAPEGPAYNAQLWGLSSNPT